MVVFVALLLGLILLLLLWFQYQLNYWKRRKIPQSTPLLLVGNMNEWGKSKNIAEILYETYNKFNSSNPFVGFHFFMVRSVVVLDINLVRDILFKDFDYFIGRGFTHNEGDHPLMGSTYFLTGQRWQQLRNQITPIFGEDQMKPMFAHLAEIGEELVAVLAGDLAAARANGESETLEIMDYILRYTSDVISSSAFGLECSSLRDPKTEFFIMCKHYIAEGRENRWMDGMIYSFPDILRKMVMRIVNNIALEFYIRLVKETIAHREKNNIERHDFMNLFIQIKNKQSTQHASQVSANSLTDVEIAAQAFSFILLGLETSLSTIGFALYELARHPQVQAKARHEINAILNRHNGVFTYECLKDMKYMEQVLNETLRMYPPLPLLMRQAHKRYETSDPKYYIEAETMVFISTMGIHYNADFYPEPHSFKPERFTPDEVRKRPSCTWLPFGNGPRNCTAIRFSKMEMLIGLISLLRRFKFSTAPETEIPCKFLKTTLFLSVKDGINLRVEKI